MIDDDDERDLRSYGRKRGRKMSPRQCALLAEVLPRIAIDLTSKPGSDPSCRRHASGMGLTPREIWLEIASDDRGYISVVCKPTSSVNY